MQPEIEAGGALVGGIVAARGRGMRTGVGTRGSIHQAGSTFFAEPVQSFVGGAHADARRLGSFSGTQAVMSHAFNENRSTIWRQTGTFMQVHPGFLEGWWVALPAFRVCTG